MHRISHKMFASVPTQNKYLLFGAGMGYKWPENTSKMVNEIIYFSNESNSSKPLLLAMVVITMLSVRCEILVTTESKLAAVSPVPGAGDDSRGTVQGYSHHPEQNQITPTLLYQNALGWHGDYSSPLV